MSPNDTVVVITTEEMLAMPDDGMERELIRGGLREKPMTRRNHVHAGIETVVFQPKWHIG